MNLSEIESKIRTDLERSGFLSEMKALEVFRANKWCATGISSFYDLDENKSRESDISAYLTSYESADEETIAQSFFHISAEVKKSERPWIIFKEVPNWEHQLGEGWRCLNFKDGFEENQSRINLTKSLQSNTISHELGWLGTGMHEFSKNPDQPSRWYSSLISVCKAAEDSLEANSWDKEATKHDYPVLNIVKPILILDGPLISASLNKEDIELEEIKYASIEFEFRTESYKRGYYLVDVVSLPSLSEYLSLCKKRHNAIFNEVKILGIQKYGTRS